MAVVIRHTGGAISAYVGVLLVLPIIFEALPDPLQYQAERLLPLSIGSAMVDNHAPHAFGPWGGSSSSAATPWPSSPWVP
jgi:ABC-2 type transport system permease protein